MSEWFKELVLKTSDSARNRGFESHPLRQYFYHSQLAEIPKWWRGSPAKGVGRETGARVQIPLSAPNLFWKKQCHFGGFWSDTAFIFTLFFHHTNSNPIRHCSHQMGLFVAVLQSISFLLSWNRFCLFAWSVRRYRKERTMLCKSWGQWKESFGYCIL